MQNGSLVSSLFRSVLFLLITFTAVQTSLGQKWGGTPSAVNLQIQEVQVDLALGEARWLCTRSGGVRCEQHCCVSRRFAGRNDPIGR